MSKLEHVIYITKIQDFKYWKPRFKRVYFGNEFCDKLIPTEEEFKKAMEFARNKNINLSLLTCQVSDFSIKKFLPLLSLLRKRDEIILNDWGIFSVLKKDFKNLLPNCILGKFLLNNIGVLSEPFQKFLESLGLSQKRLEAEIGYFSSVFDKGGMIKFYPKFKISLYYPYYYCTTARFCLNLDYGEKRFRDPRLVCSKPCQEYTFVADHPTKQGEKLFLKGKTWFKRQDISCASIKQIQKSLFNLDRLVYMPTFPI